MNFSIQKLFSFFLSQEKLIVRSVSFFLLLFGSAVFGFLERPVEMGLMIVASAIALAFSDLEKFSRIKGAGFEAELREKMVAIVEKETESDVSYEGSNISLLNNYMPTQNANAVMMAFYNSKYTWRSLNGLEKDTKLSSSEVDVALNELVTNQYARRAKSNKGHLWSLTDNGRRGVKAINEDSKSVA
jgi:hypothetical protein